MITGDYRNSLDEKGRLLIPSRIRTEIPGSLLIITQGVDKCLWLFPPDEWKRISDNFMASTSIFQARARLIQRRIVAPLRKPRLTRRAGSTSHRPCGIMPD